MGFTFRFVYFMCFKCSTEILSRKIDIRMLSIRIFDCCPGSKDFVVVAHTFNPTKECEFRAIRRLVSTKKVCEEIGDCTGGSGFKSTCHCYHLGLVSNRSGD